MIVEIVCSANFCRSPVVERILKTQLDSSVKVLSSGISPYTNIQMDPRSIAYLKELGIDPQGHFPSKFTWRKGLNANLIIACDMKIYSFLKKNFFLLGRKIKLISKVSNNNFFLNDPHQLNEIEEYFNTLDEYKELSLMWVKELNNGY